MTQRRSHVDCLYDAMTRHANLGVDCPDSAALARMVWVTRSNGIGRPLASLIKRGLVSMVEKGRDRHITILATGKTTVIPGYRNRSGLFVPPPSIPDNLPRVDRDPCPVCGVRKDVCSGHGHKPPQYIPSTLWRELVSALPKEQTA